MLVCMFAIKRELKVNNKERTLLAKHADYLRFVYNYGLPMLEQLDHQAYKGSSSTQILHHPLTSQLIMA